ncbi:SARP family transcriptional regulator [Nonomuraea sp. NN258]|uniref:AfsR/SARP family transcriptional regulator n=1 Tax=Nonomuraea antri TaxID=2730852 RepID=UPI00156998BD|nr:BTAD domain-containing putative transcriptional regulator [Nonomuraea antri]NRQ35632.1 SARP family transcriptional regulator [Nonomuraea antri]
MEFRIMGPLEVRDGAHDRTPTAPKHRDLLAMFVLNARRPLTVGRLRALLWPREGGDRSDSLVRGYIGQLRRLVGKDVITTTSGSYTLAVDPGQIDVECFRTLVERGDYDEALRLWRGPALEDVDPAGERWVETGRLRAELEELRLLAIERRLARDLDAGRHREILSELRRLVDLHSLWQRFRGLYMLALYRSGRRVEALEAYAALRDSLDDGHAIEPDSELQLLYHRMLHDDVSLHVSAGPPMLLPHDVADFCGRHDLLDRVVGGHVVIHGAAGVGKSALAVHAAWTRRERFPDGILYADLRETAEPAAVLEDFLRWLGCPAQAIPVGLDQRERLLRTYAANRRLLVLLDHASSEAQVRPLLTAAPTVITSRSALGGLTGVGRVSVGVLDDESAAELLVKLVGPGRGDASRLVRICGGLPIALRVAGSRLAARPEWTVDYLAGLLEDEHGRLDRLHAGDQTVRSVFSVGYDALAEPARRTLRRLGALSAPDFGDWVAAALGDEAEALVEAGLLETHLIDVAGQVRYRLHGLTRLFAREQQNAETAAGVPADLAMLARTARARAARFTPVSGPAFATTDIRQSAEWLLAERAFLVSLVADLGRSGLDQDCLRLAHLLVPFLERHRFLDDWRQCCAIALAAAGRLGDLTGEALILRDEGDLHRAERRWALAHDRLRQALTRFLAAGRAKDAARTRRRLGQVQLEQGRLAEAEQTLTACLPAHEDAETLHALGLVLHRTGRPAEAVARLSAAATLLADAGDRHRRVDALLDLSAVRLSGGDLGRARGDAQTARSIAVRLGDRLLSARSLLALAEVTRAEGDTGTAAELAARAAQTFRELGDDDGAARADRLARTTRTTTEPANTRSS